jgi:signal peptidase I
MKRIIIYLISGLVFIFIIFQLGSITGLLKNFIVYSKANEPTIEEFDWKFASNLISPKRLDFILYNNHSVKSGSPLWTHRLVGVPNDTLEIRDGVLYVNNRNLDKDLNLKQSYIVSFKELEKLQNRIKNLEFDRDRRPSPDSLLIFLTDEEVKQTFEPRMPLYLKPDPEIGKQYNESWSQDRFGPLIIPENKYFVLGDNRDDSYDSRFIGLINESDIKGVLFR